MKSFIEPDLAYNPGVYAKLCLHSYDPYTSYPPESWKMYLTSDLQEEADAYHQFQNVVYNIEPRNVYQLGFHAVAYFRKENGVIHVPVALVGTDLPNWNNYTNTSNLFSDLQLYLKIQPSAYYFAERFHERLVTKLKEEFPGQPIKIEYTGHSLGASLAQLTFISGSQIFKQLRPAFFAAYNALSA